MKNNFKLYHELFDSPIICIYALISCSPPKKKGNHALKPFILQWSYPVIAVIPIIVFFGPHLPMFGAYSWLLVGSGNHVEKCQELNPGGSCAQQAPYLLYCSSIPYYCYILYIVFSLYLLNKCQYNINKN